MKPGSLVLLDSSAVLATLDRGDTCHADAVRTATELARLRCRLFQTPLLRAETHALLLARVGADAARQWLGGPAVALVRPEPADELRAERLILRRRDKDYSLCDAVSFTVMERVGAKSAFTFDRHFRQHGLTAVP